MAKTVSILAVIATIQASNSWQELMTVKDAVEKRLRDVRPPKLNASQVRAIYKKDMRVTLVGLRDPFLNGLEAVVIEVAQTRLVVNIENYIGGQPYRTRIPAICAIPVPTAQTE